MLGGGTPPAPPQTVEQAVTQLAEIVGVLTADKMKKESVPFGSCTGRHQRFRCERSAHFGLWKEGCCGSQNPVFESTPEEVYQLLERMMLEDLLHQTVTPGMPSVTLNCRAWMEHRSRIGPYKTGTYLGWTAAGALDCMIQGNTAGARARLALMMLMLDQCATDRGSWTLAAELSLEQPPRMTVLATHSPPASSSEVPPFSRILDARWAEVALSHLKEAEDLMLPGEVDWEGQHLCQTTIPSRRSKQKPRRRPWPVKKVNEVACMMLLWSVVRTVGMGAITMHLFLDPELLQFLFRSW